MKVTFNQVVVAQKAIASGLKMFSMRIPPMDIQQEDSDLLQNCIRCYAIEHHTTVDCPNDLDYKIGSECASTDHLWHASVSL